MRSTVLFNIEFEVPIVTSGFTRYWDVFVFALAVR